MVLYIVWHERVTYNRCDL